MKRLETAETISSDYLINISNATTLKKKNISFYLHVAIVKGFISVDEKEKTIGNAFNFSSSFSEYVIEADSKKNKFVYGLIGSIVTVIGGLIGALITSLL